MQCSNLTRAVAAHAVIMSVRCRQADWHLMSGARTNLAGVVRSWLEEAIAVLAAGRGGHNNSCASAKTVQRAMGMAACLPQSPRAFFATSCCIFLTGCLRVEAFTIGQAATLGCARKVFTRSLSCNVLHFLALVTRGTMLRLAKLVRDVNTSV